MHQSIRERTEDDVRVIGNAISVLESNEGARGPSIERALDELRQLRKRKEDSLESPVDTSGLVDVAKR
jgi:hypothetical protein